MSYITKTDVATFLKVTLTPEEEAQVDAPAISLPLGMSLKDVKRRVTLATFEHLGKREMTAATLGISDKSLYMVLKDHLAFQREEAAALPPLAKAA